MPEQCSIPWFTTFMALLNSGVVPTVTPPDQLPSRQALLQFWGRKDRHGVTFINHKNPSYALYVRELYNRVLQLKWPLNGVIPFHFARGLMAEAVGLAVNWAEFAFKQTHLHQSHISLPRILPEYECMANPLPPLIKVLSKGNFQVYNSRIIFLPSMLESILNCACLTCIVLLTGAIQNKLSTSLECVFNYLNPFPR